MAALWRRFITQPTPLAMAFVGVRRHGDGRADSNASTRSGQGGLVWLVLLVEHMVRVEVVLGNVELDGDGFIIRAYLDRESYAGVLLSLNGNLGGGR